MDNNKQNIEIGISKKKGVVMTIIATIMFVICMWALVKIQFLDPGFDRNYLTILITSLILTIGFFGLAGLKRIIENVEGLIINNSGVQINLGPNKGHFVEWTEITKLKIHNQFQGPRFLLIFVKDPEKYIKTSSGIKKLQLKMNNKSHKTPLSIATNWLECNIEDLLEIMEEKLIKNGAQQQV